MYNFKKYIAAFTSAALMVTGAISVTGCAADTGDDEKIELLDPVSVSVSCAPVTRRNIYSSKILSAICTPDVTECAFDSDIVFSEYTAMPGDLVKAGDILISSNTSEIDERIKGQREYIASMQEDHDDTMEQLKDTEAKAKADFEYKKQIVSNLENSKPEETDAGYAAWERDYKTYDGQSRYASVAYDRAVLQIKETEELFNLDLAYQKSLLNDLIRQRNEKELLASKDGMVVALGFWSNGYYTEPYGAGDYIRKNTVGMALGDPNTKELKTNYINKGEINKAEDVYAIVNGKRYEVTYEEISTEEYKKLSEKNGNVFSSFVIDDPNGEVNYGDYAVIVLVNAKRENVLSVPASSIVNDPAVGTYVYVFQDDSYKERYIKVGAKEGQFVEVLSGLEEGEMVKSEYKEKSGASEDTVKKGSISYAFSDDGYLFYPTSERIVTGVSHGTVYLDEVLVSRYQKVEKGDVIARVHVVSDSVELQRSERELQRLNERLDTLVKEGEEDNKYAIKGVKKQIYDKEDYIKELKKDASVTKIVAACEGIITEVTSKVPGDLLGGDDSVARVASGNSCFILVEDEDGKLSFGNKVSVSYLDPNGQNKSVEGQVMTANAMSISKSLFSGYAIVQLPVDAIAEMAGSSRNADGWWSRVRVDVKANIRSMENVLIIPKKAVTDINGTPYVTVVDENGSRHMTSFIAGGSDSSNYWVVEGITEGTKICWE
ncbi:MAG: hypothetical protein IJ195_07335 [Lachnospiraceae bacterium]|nr:hypothetical protein [Lachnospiraceae bacterium]